jgi:hypothetical protein
LALPVEEKGNDEENAQAGSTHNGDHATPEVRHHIPKVRSRLGTHLGGVECGRVVFCRRTQKKCSPFVLAGGKGSASFRVRLR